MAKPYDALADVFKTGSLSRLKAEIEVGQAVWQNVSLHLSPRARLTTRPPNGSLTLSCDQDANTGLVLQLLDASRKYSVLRLERTFAALSIPEVIHSASLGDKTAEETEALVASLIASGELKGSLLQSNDPSKPTILRFATSASDSTSETQIREDLAAQKQRLTKLLDHIQTSDHKLELSREYIENLRRDHKRKVAAAKDGATAAAPGIGGGNGGEYEFEEYMMADLQ